MRGNQVKLPISVAGADRRVMAADDVEHDQGQEFESELAHVLALGVLLKELVNGYPLHDPIGGEAEHHDGWLPVDEGVEDCRQLNARVGLTVDEEGLAVNRNERC